MHHSHAPLRVPVLVVLVTGLLASCGAGTAGVLAGSGSSSVDGNSAPALVGLQLPSPQSKTSPALIRLELSDLEGETVRVQLCAKVPLTGGGMSDEIPLTRVTGPDFPANGASVEIPPGNQIRVIEAEWRFPEEAFPDWPDDGSYVEGIQLIARLGTGGELVLGDDELLSIGNDAPRVTAVTPIVPPDEGEVSGIVRVQVMVEDSSDDVVTVLAQYDIQGDEPDQSWQPAVGFGLTDVRVSRTGTTLDFFWDTDNGLMDLERQVLLRFEATDDAPATGNTLESEPFRVDNNEEPIALLFNDAVVTNSDELRGIPVPFRVIDEEGDVVDVVLQWRREGEEFPSLDLDEDGTVENEEVDAILEDPALREERHVCTQYPRHARGRVIPVDDTHVRLPELALDRNWILASGLEERVLELMRPSSVPEPITPTWISNPLDTPVAALPLGDGITALVLDAPGGNGRLREIELATGFVDSSRGSIALVGLPTAMALERGGAAVIVASELGGAWRLDRVELATGVVVELYTSAPLDEPAPVRGLASLGTQAVVFTAGSSLLHLDYRDPLLPRLATLLSGLAAPWGVLNDPVRTNRIYLSESDADRVLSVGLDSRSKPPVVLNTESVVGLDGAQALALEEGGTRLLVTTRTPMGLLQLVGVELGAQERNLAYPVGAPRPSKVTSLATGPGGLRLTVERDTDELFVGGGLQQRRRVIGYDAHDPAAATGQLVQVDVPFRPGVRQGQDWRIRADPRIRTSPEGTESSFAWDSGADLPEGGRALLRIVARDGELGPLVESTTPKRVRCALNVDPIVVGGPATTDDPVRVVVADVDGDGDSDLVSANSAGNTLTIFHQTSPGKFDDMPVVLGGLPVIDGPVSVAVIDIDGDGDMDVVSANFRSHTLTIFSQTSPGIFSTQPTTLENAAMIRPESIAAADLDGDNDVDLVSANKGSDNLTIFYQSPGGFVTPPVVLGGFPTTDGPVSVAVADLDGDGDLDLVSANDGAVQFPSSHGSDLAVFFQVSPGTFLDEPIVLGGFSTTFSPVSVIAADVDGDGDLDVVSANVDGGDVTIFPQLSPGIFAEMPLALGGFPELHGTADVAAVDMDGDGDLDIVSANRQRGGLTIFFQSSPGLFSAPSSILSEGSLVFGPVSLAASDLDGNGKVDVVSANAFSSDLAVLFQASPGTFSLPPVTLGGGLTTNQPQSVAAGDLDGDGILDLVCANIASSNLTAFLQTSRGTFADSPIVIGGEAVTEVPVSVAAADLDGDGDLDLVSANVRSDDLTIFFQDAPAVFADPPTVLGGPSVLDGPDSFVAADLDGDGDLDLVCANSNLVAYLQTSPGTFSDPPLVIGNGLGPISVAAVDFDRDGDLDLATANGTFQDLSIFRQTSPGVFAEPPIVFGGGSTTRLPVVIVPGDFDGDGDTDFASANTGGDDLTVFFQVAPGVLSGAPTVVGGFPFPDSPRALVACDADGDGSLDLVSANIDYLSPHDVGHNLTVFLQTSPGAFTDSPIVLGDFLTTQTPLSIAAADFDGDGDIDLASANNTSRNLTVFWGGR